MGVFKKPKVPKPVPPATPASNPIIARGSASASDDLPFGLSSLISTSSSGLKRKANTQKVSLIGG
jgi:hypothetical protein